MSCPRCGGTSRVMLTHGFYRCTTEFTERIPTGLPPNGAHGPAFRDVWYQCGREYQEGTGQAGQSNCDEHGLFAIGVCTNCRTNPICGDCSRRTCRACRQADAMAAAERKRVEAERQLAAKAAAAQQETERQRAHDARVRANAARYPKPPEWYELELEDIQAELARTEKQLHPRMSTPFVEKFVRGMVVFVCLAWIAGGMTPASARVPIGALFLLVGFLSFGGVRLIRVTAAKSRKARLLDRMGEVVPAIGCGSDCEYGCLAEATA